MPALGSEAFGSEFLVATKVSKVIDYREARDGNVSVTEVGVSVYTRDAAAGAKKLRTARLILWVGAFMPIIYSEARTVDQVGGVGLLELIRGGGPVVAYFIALLMVRPLRRLRWGIPEFGIAGFLVIALLSPVWAETAPMSAALKAIPLVFAYLCVARVTSLYRSPREVLDALAAIVFVLIAGALVQWALVPGIALAGEGEDSGRLQSIVPRISSNLLGVVAAVGAVAAILRVGPSWARRAWVRGSVIFASMAILLATQSRLATAVAIVATLIVVLVAAHRSPIGVGLLWLAMAALLVLVAVVAQSSSVGDRISEYIMRDQSVEAFTTLTGRTVAWDYALQLIHERPLLGFGYYVGTRLVLPGRFARFGQYNYSNIDSTWLETAVNVGWVGVGFLALFVVAGLVRVCVVDWGGRERWMAIAIVLIVATLSFINPGVQAPSVSLVLAAACIFGSRRSNTELDAVTASRGSRTKPLRADVDMESGRR